MVQQDKVHQLLMLCLLLWGSGACSPRRYLIPQASLSTSDPQIAAVRETDRTAVRLHTEHLNLKTQQPLSNGQVSVAAGSTGRQTAGAWLLGVGILHLGVGIGVLARPGRSGDFLGHALIGLPLASLGTVLTSIGAGLLGAGLRARPQEVEDAPGWRPPHPRGRTRLYAVATPFLGSLDESVTHLGLLAMVGVEYTFRQPLLLGAELAPLALLTSLDPGHTALRTSDPSLVAEPRLRIGYAGDAFGLSVLGGGHLQGGGRSGPTFGLGLRLGWLDGVNLILDSTVSLVQNPLLVGNQLSTKVGYLLQIAGTLHVPLSRGATLEIAAGGAHQWAYLSGGVRYLLRGNGAAATTLLTVSPGWAWLRLEGACEVRRSSFTPPDASLFCSFAQGTGPGLMVGLEQRL